jgi:ketosteroid isomerase-like protein
MHRPFLRCAPGYWDRAAGSLAPVPGPEPLDVVRAYNSAFEARDADAMLAYVDPDCEIVTLHRGVMRGHQPLRAFMDRQTYGVTMVPTERRYFARGDTVVVFGEIEWRYVESGELAGREQGGAVCRVRDGRIARLEIHDDLEAALESARMTEADEVPEP